MNRLLALTALFAAVVLLVGPSQAQPYLLGRGFAPQLPQASYQALSPTAVTVREFGCHERPGNLIGRVTLGQTTFDLVQTARGTQAVSPCQIDPLLSCRPNRRHR